MTFAYCKKRHGLNVSALDCRTGCTLAGVIVLCSLIWAGNDTQHSLPSGIVKVPGNYKSNLTKVQGGSIPSTVGVTIPLVTLFDKNRCKLSLFDLEGSKATLYFKD